MKVITLINEKGGCGKTTVAVHLAAGLAIKGARVLLIDTDPQGHATLMAGQAKAPGLYNLLARREPWEQAWRLVQPEFYSPRETKGSLYVLPSNVETRAIPTVVDDVTMLARRLAELYQSFDVVIIDTPPTPSMLHGSAYLATDYIVYPTKCEFLSFDGLAESIGRLNEIIHTRDRFGLPAMETLCVVPTMYRSQTLDQVENLAELKERFGDKVVEPLAMRTAWTEATTHGQLVWFEQGGSVATKEMYKVIERVMGVLRRERA